MTFRQGIPKTSGEYVVVLNTRAGREYEVVNFGLVERLGRREFFIMENGEQRVLDNVVAWDFVPDLRDA